MWQVLARDDDLGSNGQISYSLSSGNEAGAFSLTSGGQLSLIRTLDRETQDKYTLIITAHDAGKSGSTARFSSVMQTNHRNLTSVNPALALHAFHDCVWDTVKTHRKHHCYTQ